MPWTQTDTSFKKLSNKRITTSTGKGLPEEKGASTLELYLPDIKTGLIPGTPPGASTDVLYFTGAIGQTLVVDTSVPNNLTWFATTGYGNTTAANDGSALSESQRLGDWVSDKYDGFGTVSGAGYEIKVYDRNSNLITKSDSSNWLFDYQTGILVFNNNVTSYGTGVSAIGPFRIVGYRYVGPKGVIPSTYGGLGYTSYTLGDIFVGSGNTVYKLPVGSNNFVLTADSSAGYGITWKATASTGLTSLNSLSSSIQYFNIGSTGSGFNIVSSGSTHTFNIPIAGSGATGLVSTLAQTFAGQKTFTSTIIGDLTGTATTAIYAHQAGYAITAGLASTATYAYQSGYAVTSDSSSFATTAAYSYQSGYGLTSGFATTANYSHQSGYAITSGSSNTSAFATTASYAYQSGYGLTSGFATTANYSHQSGYAITSGNSNTSGLATTATYAHQSGYAITSDSSSTANIASYSHQAGYAITSGLATTSNYSHQSGYATTSGLATTATYAHQSGYAITSGSSSIATTATYSHQSGYGITSGFATTANYSHQSGYATTSGLATTATYSHQSGYGITAGLASTALYSHQSGYAVTSGFATNSSYSYQSGYGLTAGIATTALNLSISNATTNASHYINFSALASGSGVAVSSNPAISFNPATLILSTSGLAVTNTTSSTSSSSGALIVSGGVGIGGSLFSSSSYASSVSGVVLSNGVVVLGAWAGSTITSFYGGTGFQSYATGDLLVGAGNTLTKVSVGTNNYALIADSSVPGGVKWASISGFAITNINGLTASKQDFAVGYLGTVPAYSSAGNTHTLNIPIAGTGSTGLVSTQAQSFAGVKTFTNAVNITDNTGSGSYTTGALVVTGGVGVGGTLNVQGDLNVQGTFTTINSTTVNVADKNIELGVVGSPSDLTAQGGGITLRGATDKSINWYSGVGWSSSESWNLANNNVYKINGTTVLSSNTLGTGVIFSSIQTAGIITSGTWSATAITALYGGTGLVPSFVVGDILYANTSNSWGRLAASSNAGYLLASSGSGATPSYIAPLSLSVGFASTSSNINVSNASSGIFYPILSNTASSTSIGASVNNFFIFNAATGSFGATSVNIFSGQSYNIAGNSVISSSSLGTGVTNSYLTAVGTISTGVWAGTLITAFYGGTGYNSYTKGDILVGAGNTFIKLGVGPNNYVLGSSSGSATGLTWRTASSATATTSIAPLNALDGDLWYDSTDGSLSVYYDDGDSSQWVEVVGAFTGNVYYGTQSSIPYYNASGIGITGSASFTNVGTGISILYNTASTSTTTGALVVTGGVGIGGSLYTSTSSADSLSGVVLNNGVITSGNWSATAVTARYGGTGNTSYTLGDILVGAGSTFIKLPVGINGYLLGADSTQPSGVGWTSVTPLTVSDTAPLSPKNADLWFNSLDGSLLVYYKDVNTSQWVEIALGSGIDLSQQVHITNTTPSTSVSSGALVVDGGLGVSGTIHATSLSINATYDLISNVITLTTTTPNQVLGQVDASIYRSIKCMVQISRGSDYQVQEILALHDSVDSYLTQYAQLLSGNDLVLATYDTDLSGGFMRILVTPLYTNTTFRVYCQAMRD